MPFFLLPLLTGALGGVASAGAAVAAGVASTACAVAGAVGTAAAGAVSTAAAGAGTAAASVVGTAAGGITAAASSGAAAVGSAASSAIATAGSVSSSLSTVIGTAEGVIASAATTVESAIATQAAALVKAVPALDVGLKATEAAQLLNAKVIATGAAKQKLAAASIAQSLGGGAAAQGFANVVAPILGNAHAIQFAAKSGMTAASKIAGGQVTASAVGQVAGSAVSVKNMASNLNKLNVEAVVDGEINRFLEVRFAELPTAQYLDLIQESVNELGGNIAKICDDNVASAFDAKLVGTVFPKLADLSVPEDAAPMTTVINEQDSSEAKLDVNSVQGKLAMNMLLAVAATAIAKSKGKT